jgi:CubicO group peptidase (beta-lactamase class C family)
MNIDQKIEAELSSLADKGQIAGAVTLAWHRDRLLHRASVGWLDRERTRAMRPDAIFRIASMTKPIASVACLMLIEQGRMSMDDLVARWIPEFADVRVLRRPDGPLDDCVFPSRPITVFDLLTHRAGLSYGFATRGPISAAYDAALGSPFHSHRPPDEWARNLAALPLLHPPGERFVYGHSTDLLGVVIERVADMPLRDFLHEHVFEPLDMRDTDFFVPRAKLERVADTYQYDFAQQALVEVPWLQPPEHHPAFDSGGQGLWSTANDYLQFARMLLNGGELAELRILNRESVRRLRTNTLTDAQREFPVMGIPMWSGMGFGLGVAMITEPDKLLVAAPGAPGAYGWPGVLGTWWQVDPASELILLYFTGLVSFGLVPQVPPGSRGQQLFRQLAYRCIAADRS